MAKFRVYVFDNKEEYTKAQNLIHEKRFNSSSSIHHEMHPDHEQAEKMLKYNTEQKEFDSWDKTSEFIDNKDYTIWKELGEDLEEKTICKACNSKVNTNSEELLRELREVHHINCSTKMRK